MMQMLYRSPFFLFGKLYTFIILFADKRVLPMAGSENLGTWNIS